MNDEKANWWRIARAKSALGEAQLGQGRIDDAEAQLTFASAKLADAKGWAESDARMATEERMQRLQQVKTQLLTRTAHRK